MRIGALLRLILIVGAECYLGWVVLQALHTNAGLLETTAMVTAEPVYGVAHQTPKRLWNADAGYTFDYSYTVDGRTYSGRGFRVDKPGPTTLVYYDAKFPSNSRTDKEQTGLVALLMVVLAVGGLYNATQVDWRSLLGRR